MNFTPEQIQNNLGKYNTEQYEYGKLENTGDNREKVANQPASKQEVDELKKMIANNTKKDREQEARINNAIDVNRRQDEDILKLDTTMRGSESDISMILAQNGLNYNPNTGMFAEANPTKEPGVRIFGADSQELEARQA